MSRGHQEQNEDYQVKLMLQKLKHETESKRVDAEKESSPEIEASLKQSAGSPEKRDRDSEGER